MDYLVDLDIFRGPLDLLLYLVKRHEVDICDIPIAASPGPVIFAIAMRRSSFDT